jgi:hypothetical protein
LGAGAVEPPGGGLRPVRGVAIRLLYTGETISRAPLIGLSTVTRAASAWLY